MRKVIFCNIAWMTDYSGYTDDDKAFGGGSYKAEWKHEQFNFMIQEGKCYGYVQPPLDEINLQRIDPTVGSDASELDDVLVVFTAPKRTNDPDEKGSYIVGWYNHAVAHRFSLPRNGYAHYSYYFEANADDCVLLPENERKKRWKFRRSPEYGDGYMGRANVWYADPKLGKYDHDKIQEVTDYVEKIIDKIETYKRRIP